MFFPVRKNHEIHDQLKVTDLSRTKMTEQFNTIQYCIDNLIPCFTFAMDYDKKNFVKNPLITPENQAEYLNPRDNGFAIITGRTHIMIDIDLKNGFPEEILTYMKQHGRAYERTPGGFHFYFKADERGLSLKNHTDMYWNGIKIQGLDFRVRGGISYCTPSNYINKHGEHVKYQWIHGNISTAEVLPAEIWEMLDCSENMAHLPAHSTLIEPEEITDEKWEEIVALVGMLSMERATGYDCWRDVIFCLRHTEGSQRMLDLCHTFSKKSSKYDARSVDKKWREWRYSVAPLTIKSLYYWAKHDAPDAYMALRSKNKAIEYGIILGTNAHLADVFYALNPYRYLYSSEEGWYALQENNVWKATGSTEIKSIPAILNAIREDCRSIVAKTIENNKKEEDSLHYKQITQTAKMLGSATFIKGVTEFLKGKYYVCGVEKQFNQNRDLLAFENGVMDTRTFLFRETQPNDYITITTGYHYRPATNEEKKKVSLFLSRIFPHRSVFLYMLQAIGTCLTGHNQSECFHILTGIGANGKSLLMDLCRKVLGEFYKTMSVSYLTQDDRGRDRVLPELTATRYARMVVSSEPESKERFQVNFMKMIAGNDEITCRGLYKSTIRFFPHFKLWIPSNDIPQFSKYDRGIERRTRCVHFPTRFVHEPKNENEEKRDETLKQKIEHDDSWKYGMLELLLDALKSLNGEPLIMPDEVAVFTEKYLLENNPIGSWIKKYYDRTENREDIIQRTDLYRQFLQDTGKTISQKVFSEDIVKCDISSRQIDSKYYYHGLVRKNIIINEEI